MTDPSARPLRVAVAGLGAIGKAVVRHLVAGLPGLVLTAVAGRDRAKTEASLRELGADVPILPLERLAEQADLVVEALPAAAFDAVARPTLAAGRMLMAVSAGALLGRDDLIDLARQSGGRIVVPTGALLGLDAVAAAAEGKIHSVRMVTRKPPKGLAGAPYLVEKGISLDGLNTARKIYEGPAREAVRGFPANVNVAAALSLAGIGPDRTTIEIWADPGIDRNRHAIVVDSDSAWFSLEIANIPSENPKTGRITAQSVIAALRRLRAPLRVGT
ncbi:MAG: aspartate dehydrogenase [Alphaproteobacteria bacterium]|nr:aspartate dehydrogenase [Alphaproteobacteria bacterium]